MGPVIWVSVETIGERGRALFFPVHFGFERNTTAIIKRALSKMACRIVKGAWRPTGMEFALVHLNSCESVSAKVDDCDCDNEWVFNPAREFSEKLSLALERELRRRWELNNAKGEKR